MADTQIQGLLERAQAAYVAGDLAKEEAILTQIVAADANQVIAQLRLATILTETNRKAEAISNLEALLERQPDTPQARLQLAVQLLGQGRFVESIHHFERLVRQYPDNLGALVCLAQANQSIGRPKEAVTFLDRALELRPGEPDFLYARAQCLQDLRKVAAAEADLNKALARSPKPHGYLMLAEIDLQSSRYRDAQENASRAIALEPGLAGARILSAKALMSLGEMDAAEQQWAAAASLTSDKAGVLREKGKEYSSQGMFVEANEALNRSIQEDPSSGETCYLLVSSRRCGPEDQALVSKMQDVLAGGSLPPIQEQKLCYAIGKAHDDLGEYGEALKFFDRANKIGSSLFSHDALSRDVIKDSTDAIIARYTAEFIAEFRDLGDPSALPIFVIGMMRSGTTLVEQLLSAHPLIGGGGEQPFWMEYEAEFAGPRPRPFNAERLRDLAGRYLQVLSAASPGCAMVVDKNNCNSYLAGILAIAFPNSKVIHVQRNPIDTALSIWTTELDGKGGFLSDRSNIVFLLQEHLRLARHWSRVIPEARFTELRYERLVDDTEAEMRRVVGFLGLEWHGACCRPEANQRTVRTPSYWQTRQPIYKRSSQRWKKYEPWLGEFADLLTETEA